MRSAPILVHGTDPLGRVQRFDYVLASLPELQAAAHGQAMLSVALEQGVVRHIPLIMGLGEKLVPSLPMEMLRLATDSSAIDVFADTSGVQAVGVADVLVPTQPGGDIWLHFASIRSTLSRYVSARDILQGTVDPERFRNKLVLVGLTGTGVTDMRTTALGELVPGIEIQAQVIETIFEGRFLRRPTWLKWAESAFIMTFGSADHLVCAPRPIAVCDIPKSRSKGFHHSGRLAASAESVVLLPYFHPLRTAGRCGLDFHYPVRSHGLFLCTRVAACRRTGQNGSRESTRA